LCASTQPGESRTKPTNGAENWDLPPNSLSTSLIRFLIPFSFAPRGVFNFLEAGAEFFQRS
jgi:hypothetical protein